MTPPLITAALIALFGLAVWWSLPRPKTRHWHSVLMRLAKRDEYKLVYKYMTRETERSQS